ncbi:uncharacterized protein RHOBADRAFT_42472 [Rhodotorula graminis WP1]|uniref:Uncharacterized protein n=1 Tax=Rhodotorula graminis (strain WP1) TaxID=578459 RepID=A0A194S6M4_RHOGW|nr:uncharacterized protein RHOBADRAFT_42472 [Rhodotorula graminis WP1]KPV76145.1 hypothetical protein RHOBADRAFT_42472 [Rhodotorula graminis WP1]
MPPPPDPRPTNLFVPSKRASSGRNPPPPPAPPPGRAPHRPPAAAYNGSTSSTSSYNGRPTADAGYGPTSHPPSSNGGRSTVANPFRPPAPTGAPAPRRRASGAFDRGELAAKTRLAVTDLMGVVRDLRDDAHEAAQFRFPLDGPDGDALAAKVADQRARDAAERKAVIDEGHARLTASALDLVRAVVDGVSSDAIARPSRDLDELRDQVRQLMSQTRTDPAPAAS